MRISQCRQITHSHHVAAQAQTHAHIYLKSHSYHFFLSKRNVKGNSNWNCTYREGQVKQNLLSGHWGCFLFPKGVVVLKVYSSRFFVCFESYTKENVKNICFDFNGKLFFTVDYWLFSPLNNRSQTLSLETIWKQTSCSQVDTLMGLHERKFQSGKPNLSLFE